MRCRKAARAKSIWGYSTIVRAASFRARSWSGGTRRRPTGTNSTAHCCCRAAPKWTASRSEEHTSELQSLMRISYAVFCLKKQNKKEYHSLKTNYHIQTTQ